VRRLQTLALMAAGLVATGCASNGTSTTATGATPAPPTAAPLPSAVVTPTPAPLPPYAIDALRVRPRASSILSVGPVLAAGGGYIKHSVTWTSMGSTMTGVLDIPAGAGPFPVVVVNHGYVPASLYYVGQDSSKYADPLAAAGFVTVSPNYPGYAGSGLAEADVPALIGQAISDMDLITALAALPQADVARVGVLGHSNGGGVAQVLLAADARVGAAVLYAPVSSNMVETARRFWVDHPGASGPLEGPDGDPAAYALMSPRFHLPRGGPPTLLMQGTRDEDIPAAWTQGTVAALQDAGIRTQVVSFVGAFHNFQGADLLRANGLAIDWLRGSIGT
jgi:dipeptidyl aminopeptidase/acylaminoacyl peptidase